MSKPVKVAAATILCTVSLGWVGAELSAQVKSDSGGSAKGSSAGKLASSFLQAHPGSAYFHDATGRVRRVYGKSFSTGPSPQASAQNFIDQAAGIFGVPVADILPIGRFADGRHVQPIMFNKATGQYKFTGVYYTQHHGGLPVFRGEVVGLVRNVPGNPLVLVSANLFNLGDFKVDPAIAGADATAQVLAAAQARFGPNAQVARVKPVIWAGVEDELAAPRVAHESLIINGFEEWRLVTDAATGAILLEEDLICAVDISGNVTGLSTEGVGAIQCEAEVPFALPYLNVTTGLSSGVTDVNGDFVIPNGGTGPINVSAGLDGLWFDVVDFTGPETTESLEVTPPGPANLLFNAENNDERVQAQVNAYVGANAIRDYVLEFNPDYPTLSNNNFAVNTNRTDGFCPGNAWYSQGDESINFCLSAACCPNTSFASVIYHEYGHHLVQVGNPDSGQGQYGEGMGDTMSVLMLDSPLLGLGFFGECDTALRNADNSHQFPCDGEAHECGQLISGCVWSTRNELLATNPTTYLDILSNLAINSMIFHVGSNIDPSITIDYLTLDDDDADLTNGTPHYNEINAGFSAHNMPAPAPLEFTFPNGLPSIVHPSGTTSVVVDIEPVLGIPEPGTAAMHVDDGSGTVVVVMTEVSPTVYEAVFPASNCGSSLQYFFTAETTLGLEVTTPTFTAFSATGSSITFQDDFETNQGWTVTNSPGLADGAWNRGVPVEYEPQDFRGAPEVDGDGSGQCYLTDNAEGNSDVDDGSTTLTSPVLDALDPNSVISYWRWYHNSFGNAPFSDTFQIQISVNGGTSWTNLELVGPAGPEVSGGWFHKDFLLSDVPGFVPTSQFRVKFIAADLGDGSVVEAAVDGVSLYVLQCDDVETCPADLGNDGDVGAADLGNLLAAWGTNPGGPPDFDLNGNVGPEDLGQLLSSWGACP
jgi:hypothetical protein